MALAKVRIGHFSRLAWLTLLAVTAIIATRDAEGEAHVAAIEVHAHGGLLAGVKRVHRIDQSLSKGRALLAVNAILAGCTYAAAWDVEAEIRAPVLSGVGRR